MPNISQRYISALGQLSQFACVEDKETSLTHVLSGVKVDACSTDPNADEETLTVTFASGHRVSVNARLYLNLQLAEDAAHKMHSTGNEGQGEIHSRSALLLEHLVSMYGLTK